MLNEKAIEKWLLEYNKLGLDGRAYRDRAASSQSRGNIEQAIMFSRMSAECLLEQTGMLKALSIFGYSLEQIQR